MSSVTTLGHGNPLNNQSKEILQKIHKYFESELENNLISTLTADELVANATGVTRSVLKRVLTENTKDKVISEPISRKRRRKNITIMNDDGESQAIRKMIHSFYTKVHEFPNLRDLHVLVRADLDYRGTLCTFRRYVEKLGFQWIKDPDNKWILIEKHDIRFLRTSFLTNIETTRSKGCSIVYTAEIEIEYSQILPTQNTSGENTKLVILLAGDDQDLMRNCLYMYDVKGKNKKECFEEHEKWLKNELIPVLKHQAVVVVDGGTAFYNRVLNPLPNFCSKKEEMLTYLDDRRVPTYENSFKPQLYQLLLMNKDKIHIYKTNQLLYSHGYVVLRLPAQHSDLNPVKSILLSHLRQLYSIEAPSIKNLIENVTQIVYSISQSDYKYACDSVLADENVLKVTETIIDELLELRCFATVDNESDESDNEEDN